MASTKTRSAQIDHLRPVLDGMAKNLANELWGEAGPEWGTRLSELEQLVTDVRKILSEKLLHEACQRQAESEPPPELQGCPECRGTTEPEDPEPRVMDTAVGGLQWQEHREYCTRCRRAFFPSVQKFGH